MFALTPDLTSARDKPPAHAEARDFKGLLPANSGISSIPRIIHIAPSFAMKISALRLELARREPSQNIRAAVLQTHPRKQ